MAEQLECRIVVRYAPGGHTFRLGMYCPATRRIEWLGTHARRDADRVVGGLRERIERERHSVTYSEQTEQ